MSGLPSLNVFSKLQDVVGMNSNAAATEAKTNMPIRPAVRMMMRLLRGFCVAVSVGAGVGGGYCWTGMGAGAGALWAAIGKPHRWQNRALSSSGVPHLLQ